MATTTVREALDHVWPITKPVALAVLTQGGWANGEPVDQFREAPALYAIVAGANGDATIEVHPEGCSCGAPDCPQHVADLLGQAHAD